MFHNVLIACKLFMVLNNGNIETAKVYDYIYNL